MGITVHFVDDDLKLNSIQIACKYIPESHTSLYLKEQIDLVLKEYNIESKVVAGSSDTARNINKTISTLMTNILYVPCLCHKLNLVIRDILDSDKEDNELNVILTKCRKLVGCFKHSNLLTEKLNKYFTFNEKELIKLKQEVITRWNSTYIMLKSILKASSGIREVLNQV